MVRRGFTLIELLVVVVIIAALIAIIIPAVKAARVSANAATCMTNMRQLGVGFMAFSAAHIGKLPGNHSQNTEGGGALQTTATPDPDGYPVLKKPENAWMGDWLAGLDKNWNDLTSTNEPKRIGFYAEPTRGTIYEYVTSIKAYRCPTLEVGVPKSGVGSNGRFDYTYPQCLNGARVDRVARYSYANSFNDAAVTNNRYPGDHAKDASYRALKPKSISIATPVLVEESPVWYMNSGNNLDGAWCWMDQTTYNHKGGTNIMTLDGSCYWFQPPYKFVLHAEYLGMRSTANSNIRWGDTDDRGYGWFNSF